MRLLLDTAVVIYAVEFPERLSRRAATAVRNLDNALELSAISVTEIAIKVASGKLAFSPVVLRRAMDDLGIRILPYTADHAFRMFGLSRHHNDPFDRQIIAQALSEKISVVTPDEKFRLYEGITVVW
ncbi:MAG: type II toxin-antitoxin system VapC family toxin [Candidatus Sulfotelmatobacter sp.]|jgi:PIN domain nuclease of toxin-antitoxin system